MSKLRRAGNIILSLLMIVCSILLFLDSEDAPMVVAVALGIVLLISGLRKLMYYFMMARHMVGGLLILFIAIITVDIGGFAILLTDEPRLSLALYIVGYNSFTAIIGIVRVVESKMIDSHWKASLLHSIINLALAVACLVFINSDQILIGIFCIGFLYAAFTRLVRAIRPTEIIYIQ